MDTLLYKAGDYTVPKFKSSSLGLRLELLDLTILDNIILQLFISLEICQVLIIART